MRELFPGVSGLKRLICSLRYRTISSKPLAGMLPSRQVVIKYGAPGMSQWGNCLRRMISSVHGAIPGRIC